MIGALIHLIIVALILGLVYWVATMLPIPEPFKQIVVVVVLVVALIILLLLLLQLAGISAPSLL